MTRRTGTKDISNTITERKGVCEIEKRCCSINWVFRERGHSDFGIDADMEESVILPFALGTSPIQDLIVDYNNIDFILPITLTGLRKLIISHNRLNIGIIRTPLPSMLHLDIRHNPAIQFADRTHNLPNISRYYHDPIPDGILMPTGMQCYM